MSKMPRITIALALASVCIVIAQYIYSSKHLYYEHKIKKLISICVTSLLAHELRSVDP